MNQFQFIISEVKRKVIGQDEAVLKLATFFLKRQLRLEIALKTSDNAPKSSNILIYGESGSGKTHLIKTFAEIMKFPLIEINAGSLSQRGWEGVCFEEIIETFIKTEELKAKKAEEDYKFLTNSHTKPALSNNDVSTLTPIIYLDEFDKLIQPNWSSKGNVSIHLQAQLLKYIEGSSIDIKGRKIDTKLFTFVFSGAFENLLENKKITTGFIQDEQTKEQDLQEALTNFGMLPELAGRINSHMHLRKLEKADFLAILESPSFILSQWNHGLRLFNNSFNITERDKEQIVEYALNHKLGVRGMIQEAEKVLDKELANMYGINEELKKNLP